MPWIYYLTIDGRNFDQITIKACPIGNPAQLDPYHLETTKLTTQISTFHPYILGGGVNLGSHLDLDGFGECWQLEAFSSPLIFKADIKLIAFNSGDKVLIRLRKFALINEEIICNLHYSRISADGSQYEGPFVLQFGGDIISENNYSFILQ